MLSVVKSDVERADVINKVFKMLSDLKTMSFFNDLVSNVHPTLVNNIEKCEDVKAKEQLRNGLEMFLTHLSDSETKTQFTLTLNKL